jgi:hypothetical protein
LLASRQRIFGDRDYLLTSDERILISWRIANLLSAGKMYVDHIIHQMNKIYGKDSYKFGLIKKAIHYQYDDNVGYRVIDALRNDFQHRNIPIQGVTTSFSRTDNDNEHHQLIRMIPRINLSALEDGKKFKQSVLLELKNIEDDGSVDIRPHIRVYMECIGKIHEKVRKIIGLDLVKWEKVLDAAISKYHNKFGNDSSSIEIAIVKINDDGHRESSKQIFKEFIDRRKSLEKKNMSFINLHNRYVSNEVRKGDG